MRNHGWSRQVAGWVLALLAAFGTAGATEPPVLRPGPTPLQDDAALHDIQFVGSHSGWAVGDHGVIWNTTDSGQSWSLQHSPVSCSLRSVSFLTDKVGWIAGGQSQPYVLKGQGVVLATDDGGTTWRQVGGLDLPEFHKIKFFTLTHGVAAGEPSSRCPSGISVTKDGGKSWQSAPGATGGHWRAADFLSPDLGAVAGLRGEHSLFGNGQLVQSKLGKLGLRGLAGLKLLPGGEGWLVGDGGLILHQQPGGTVWEAPQGAPPRPVRELFDFRAVAVRGQKVWVAGDPGTIIWHSPDAGATWQAFQTQQSLPIRALHFPTENVGWAVGELGTILQSIDGGETWLPVRGAERRVAYMALLSHVDRVSLPLITAISGDAGYRGLVSVIPRYDVGEASIETRETDLKLTEATLLAGGSAARISWRLPIDIPGLEHNAERLVEELTKRSEGELQNQLVTQFVRQIRTWRPSVIVLDQPSPDDVLARLISEIALQAIPEAADPACQIDQQTTASLPAWKVERVFMRLPPGSQGAVSIGAYDMLLRRGSAVQIAAAPALARLYQNINLAVLGESYKPIDLAGNPVEHRGQDFFASLGISPGTAARRPLELIPPDEQQRRLKLAQRQRNFMQSAARALTDVRQSSNLIAHLGSATVGMPDDQAALIMAQLADAYRRLGQWELAEATLVELVERYPHEPAAQDAMRWLVQFWSSAEIAHLRLQATQFQRQMITVNRGELLRQQQLIGQRLPTNGDVLTQEIELTGGRNPSRRTEQLPFTVETGSKKELRQEKVTLWQDKARRMVTVLQRTSPAWYQAPEVQMPLAALLRSRMLTTEANECYHTIMGGGDQTPWQKTAATELWLNQMAGEPPKKLYGVRMTPQAPVLDGFLNDECWQGAAEMPLTSLETNGPLSLSALALVCYDSEYLYFGCVCPRVPGTPDALPNPAGRDYDSDLENHDRITLMLDLDRDYVTYCRFTIDQRGWTNEDLWGDRTWNPKWYVAAEGDADGWRCEVAIPWKELTSHAPTANSFCAATVIRTIPAHGTQSWTAPATARQKLETGGLFKFE